MATEPSATDRTVLMEPESKPSATKPPARGSRVKRWLIGLGAGAAVLGVAYGTGRFQTWSRIDEAEALASAKAAQWSTEHATVLRLEARRALHQALEALDARNFGIAEEHLTAAAALLGSTHPDSGSDLEKLQKELAAYQLKASENIGAEHDQINAWIRRFDDTVPAAKP